MFNPNLSTTHRCHLTDTGSLTCWTNNTFVCVLLICQGSSLIHQKVAPPAEGHGSPVLSFIALEQFNAVRLVQVSALLRTIALAAVITQPCSNAVGGKTKKNTRHRRVWLKTSASTPSFTRCFMSWRVPFVIRWNTLNPQLTCSEYTHLLLQNIHQSLAALSKVIRGTQLLTPEVQKLASALLNQEVRNY